MMNRFAPILTAIVIAATATITVAQKPQLFPLEDLRPGMKGTARTVFSGAEPQEFGVEILGVLPGFPGPRQSAIIARLSGSNVEKTGVFAGMSGSPVYIDGKIVGAIAFSFPFSKDPIAGITPIKQMIDLFNKGSENLKPKEPRVVSFAQLAGTDWKPNLPKPAVSSVSLFAPVSAGSPLMPLLGQQMTPIATPLVFSGISQESLAAFAPQLIANGLLPVSGAGGSAPITPLAEVNANTFLPGSSISVQLVRGDYSLAAAGTVTLRDEDR
ncbi:MAG TPA: SpoIVB peptidase S55 domain-containing protein, partial [Pyrinomonadaceae bacterium]|nr:SpoIVB peptidase S55 domain-containing protein [Pyrinomonadaceae bacterium]